MAMKAVLALSPCLGAAWDAQSTRYADAECSQLIGTEVNWTKAGNGTNCFHWQGGVSRRNLQLECNAQETGQMLFSIHEGENCSGAVVETVPFLDLDTQSMLEYFAGKCTWIPDGESYGLMAQADGLDLMSCYSSCLPANSKVCQTDISEASLFELGSDPLEQRNLAWQKPRKVAELRAEMDAKFKEQQALPTFGDPGVPQDAQDMMARWGGLGPYKEWQECGSKDCKPPKKSWRIRSGATRKEKAPHIIFFMADDWGVNDIGFNSTHLSFATPTMDAMKAGGIHLKNYYGASSCSPARATFLTGRYTHRTGFHKAPPHPILNTKYSTIADEFKALGYHTVGLGKWHMGFENWTYHPLWRGFDDYYGFWSGYIGFWDYESIIVKDNKSIPDMFDNLEPAAEAKSRKWAPTLLKEKARMHILNHAANYDTPLFMYYAMHSMHNDGHGFDAPESYQAMCKVKNQTDGYEGDKDLMVKYCAGLIAMDEAIDDVFGALQETKMFSNSVVVLSGDNGGRVHYPERYEAQFRKKYAHVPSLLGMMQLSPFGSSYPYRGGKFDQSEGGYRIPGLIYSPLLPDSAKGTTYAGLFHMADWLPTLYGLAAEGYGAMDALDGLSLDGYDMWSALTAGGDPRQFVCLQYPNAYLKKETLHGETKIWKVIFGEVSKIEGAEKPIVFFEPGESWVNSTCLRSTNLDADQSMTRFISLVLLVGLLV
ncbi:unnamed protein product [Effrenium voratum]|nr:unnamed protein product [Effrenium voratum]